MARKKGLDMQDYAPVAAFAIVVFALALAFFLISENAGAPDNPPIQKNAQARKEVRKLDCVGNETRACQIDGCAGNETCENGYFRPCATPGNVCIPGQRIACNIDGCAFGYMICDPCGTGFGGCFPVDGNATGGPCTEGKCG